MTVSMNFNIHLVFDGENLEMGDSNYYQSFNKSWAIHVT